MKNAIKVINSNLIEFTFYHKGVPSWTSETWERQSCERFKCVHSEASNYNFDADGKIKDNDDMVRYIKKWNATDCEIKFY